MCGDKTWNAIRPALVYLSIIWVYWEESQRVRRRRKRRRYEIRGSWKLVERRKEGTQLMREEREREGHPLTERQENRMPDMWLASPKNLTPQSVRKEKRREWETRGDEHSLPFSHRQQEIIQYVSIRQTDELQAHCPPTCEGYEEVIW